MAMSLPINVYCEYPTGKELIAQVANVNDVKLFFEPYGQNLITWNCDDLGNNDQPKARQPVPPFWQG